MASYLHPTLWRTCRTLANLRRLRALRAVGKAGELSVSMLAARCGVPPSSATQLLRLLQSRGLLAVRRRSRFVYYRLRPDPDVRHAASLLRSLRLAFRRGDTDEHIMRMMTAFTHARRIAIVRALDTKTPCSAAFLAHRCGISAPAVQRHLRKLLRRAFVTSTTRGQFALSRPPSRLAACLLALARART